MSKVINDLGVSAFLESMGMMLQAGISTEEAVGLLIDEKQTGGVLEQALLLMREKIAEGANLSEAMEASGAFPEFAVHMISAADDAGRTEQTCFKLSKYYEKMRTIRTRLRAVVIYPAAMIFLIICVLIVMLAAALPVFSDVYENLTGSLAASAFRYIRWSYGICITMLVLLSAVFCMLIIGYLIYRFGNRQAMLDLVSVIPAARKLLQQQGLMQFTSALEMYLASGDMQDSAVEKSIRLVQCRPLEKKLEQVLKLMQEEGHNFSEAAYRAQLFEPVYSRMLQAGERSGQLDDVLARLNQLTEEDMDTTASHIVAGTEPVLSAFLIVAIGISLLSVMLPLVGIMNSIG